MPQYKYLPDHIRDYNQLNNSIDKADLLALDMNDLICIIFKNSSRKNATSFVKVNHCKKTKKKNERLAQGYTQD